MGGQDKISFRNTHGVDTLIGFAKTDQGGLQGAFNTFITGQKPGQEIVAVMQGTDDAGRTNNHFVTLNDIELRVKAPTSSAETKFAHEVLAKFHEAMGSGKDPLSGKDLSYVAKADDFKSALAVETIQRPVTQMDMLRHNDPAPR